MSGDADLLVRHDLRVPLRDGVELALDVVSRHTDGPNPVILVRTPYDKSLVRTANRVQHERFVAGGYTVAVNDCRGRFNSDGVFTPYFDEADDGHDVIEWIAAQTWCDGNVGMIGASYAGQAQWYAASTAPPHLRAIVPIVSPPASLWRNEPILNGVLLLALGEWLVAMGRRSWQVTPFAEEFTAQDRDYFATLPIRDLPAAAGTSSAWWDEWMRHPTYDDFWRRGEYGHYDRITVPALNVTGWWDMNFPGAPLNFEALAQRDVDAGRDTDHQLVIGPWPHRVNRSNEVSGVVFPDSVIDLDGEALAFFDRHLRGVDTGSGEEGPVRVYVVGANEWWTEPSWPLPDTEYVAFYLDSAGRANTLHGDGRLDRIVPTTDGADAYLHDPGDPVHTHWRLDDGPVDDSTVLHRADVLCYTSPPLSEPLDVVGWVRCRLFAASSARDTDWHVRLCDVEPDGTSRFLCHGVLRARFRTSWSEPELLEPGRVEPYDISMDAAGVRFLPGHRIRLEVMSSWFSRYDRNLNRGSENPFTECEPVIARQSVHHGPDAPSHLLLPVISR